jgi:hypothetical protein
LLQVRDEGSPIDVNLRERDNAGKRAREALRLELDAR